MVWGKGKLWQHTVTLLAAPGSERAKLWAKRKPSLPPGKYLIKVYVDSDGEGEEGLEGRARAGRVRGASRDSGSLG